MSTTITGSTCPSPPTTQIVSLGTDKGAAAFRAKTKPQVDEKSWWEHSVRIELTFCDAKNLNWVQDIAEKAVSCLSKRVTRDRTYGYSRSDAFTGLQVTALSGNTYEIKAEMKGREAPGTIKAALEKEVAGYFEWLVNHKLSDAKFSFDSEQKKEVTRYTVPDGFERV